METPEEFTGSNDHALIIRGKRTKRPRAAAAVTSSLSSGGGSYDVGDDFYFSILSSTPKSSSGETSRTSTEEEEDEDLANCLILLAQGVVPKIEKISAQGFADVSATTTTGGRAGFYVYECKTCNRTFSSFQALGGHRASHKKPKTAAAEEGEERQFTKISSPLPLHHFPTTTRAPQQILHNIAKASKVHECSTCGAEFSSGQALGGHMRRHRAAPNSRIAAISGEESHRDEDEDEEEEEDEKRRKILPLDLNLPAPMEDYEHHHHQRDAKFLDYTVTNKQHLDFSGPALVDCHY